MLQLFLQTTEASLDTLQTAWENRDANLGKREAHSLRGAAAVHSQVLDINDDAGQQQAVEAAWLALGQVDVVLVAHGTLPDQAACENSAAVWRLFLPRCR